MILEKSSNITFQKKPIQLEQSCYLRTETWRRWQSSFAILRKRL